MRFCMAMNIALTIQMATTSPHAQEPQKLDSIARLRRLMDFWSSLLKQRKTIRSLRLIGNWE
jgi:hypothetical protein